MPVVGVVSQAGWRAAWLAVPTVAALVALVLVRLRPADPPSRRTGAAASAWRNADVARFTLGELLANAAWASVLTYSGTLLLGSYDVSPAVVGLGLGAAALAMVPGAFTGRRGAARPTPALLTGLTAFQAACRCSCSGLCGQPRPSRSPSSRRWRSSRAGVRWSPVRSAWTPLPRTRSP
jgi:predicted MFS family arabinose efflux permease